jgi:anti-sigma factor RsiW
MMTCSECSAQCLDYLYGLLDEQEAQILREHLTGCKACQTALDEAKGQQALLARAARKYREVPLFRAPAEESDAPAPAPAGASPATLLARPRRPWRRWVGAAVAAGLLLTVGTLYAGFQQGVEARRVALNGLRRDIESIDGKLAGLSRQLDAGKEVITNTTQGKFLHLQLLGPVSYQTSAPNAYRLTTQTPPWEPAPTQVTVKLLDEGEGEGPDRQVLFSQQFASKGELQFTLPAKLPVATGTNPRLLVQATNTVTTETVEQALTVAEPTYATHVALNKTRFRSGDKLLFRTVTLDRFALTPIERPMTLDCNLCRLAGSDLVPVKELQAVPGTGGVTGGELILTDDLQAGDYVFTVAEAGKAVAGVAKARPTAFPNLSNTIAIEKPGQMSLDNAVKTKAAPPAKPAASLVDLFPEGGDLVAGSINRVYCRIRRPNGLLAELEGIVEDGKQREVARIKFAADKGKSAGTNSLDSARATMSTFTFTPRAGEVYFFRLVSAGRQLERVELPPTLPSGVALTIPEAVVGPDQPLRMQVRSMLPKPLLVLASCRGHLVDQKIIDNATTLTDLALEPVAGVGGVMRVTVYTQDTAGWHPAAERLAYRRPRAGLKVTADLKKGPGKSYKPGEQVNMTIETRAKGDALTPSWIFAAVMDEQSLLPGDTPEASLPAYFLLGTSLPDPQELEDADFLLSDAASAASALDLLLGTHGWRRFAAQPTSTTKGLPALEIIGDQKKVEAPALFVAGTQKEVMFDSFKRAVKQDREALAREVDNWREALQAERSHAEMQAHMAAAELEDYKRLPLVWLRYASALCLVILILVGAGLLVIGLFKVLRGRASPRWWLASSMAAMAMALVVYMSSYFTRNAGDTDAAASVFWLNQGKMRFPELDFMPEVAKQQNLAAQQQDLAARADKASKISNSVYAANMPRKEMQDGVIPGRPLDRGTPAPFKGAGLAFGGPPGAGAKGGKAKAADLKKDAAAAQKDIQQIAPGAQKQGANVGNQVIDIYNNRTPEVLQQNTVLRQYQYNQRAAFDGHPEMVLWHPFLPAPDGTATATFDLSPLPTNYRVLIYANSADGALGSFTGKLSTGK